MDVTDIQVSDPVCGMKVTTRSAWSTKYQGEEYYFCSDACQGKFEADPPTVLAMAAQREVREREEAPGEHSCCSHGGGNAAESEVAVSQLCSTAL